MLLFFCSTQHLLRFRFVRDFEAHRVWVNSPKEDCKEDCIDENCVGEDCFEEDFVEDDCIEEDCIGEGFIEEDCIEDCIEEDGKGENFREEDCIDEKCIDEKNCNDYFLWKHNLNLPLQQYVNNKLNIRSIATWSSHYILVHHEKLNWRT